MKRPQPLILTDSAKPSFVMPNNDQKVIIPQNSSILFVCPGKNNKLYKFGDSSKIKATCVSGKQFIIESEIHELNYLNCTQGHQDTVIKRNETCLGKHVRYDIGFYIDTDVFLPTIEICRDGQSLRTYYAKSTISKAVMSIQAKMPPTRWKFGKYYPGYDMNDIYKQDNQIKSLTLQLGSERLARIRANSIDYFNRGHYTARADFVYHSQQSSTYWHLNTAPQWSKFNAQNWGRLEVSLRKLASKRAIDLEVYTGVHGLLHSKHVNGTSVPLYLHANQTHRAIPIPKFYWKVVHEKTSNRAIAFVGSNDQFDTKDSHICEDIGRSTNIKWLKWKPNDASHGISYVCQVDDLRRVVPTVPNIGHSDLLV